MVGKIKQINDKSNKFITNALTFGFLVLILSAAFAFGMAVSKANAANGINKSINYQGKLMYATGTLVNDGNFAIKFTLYDSASGGTQLWSASTTNGLPGGTPAAVSVAIVDGLFSVLLGDASLGHVTIPETIFNNDNVYLGITIGADSEMQPRKRLSAVPYAFNAGALQGQKASSTIASTGGELFKLSQNSADAAVATRTALLIESLGTSNQYDYLLRLSDGNSDVFTINRQGNATTTGSLAVADFLAVQGIRLDATGTNNLSSGAYLVGVYDEFTFSNATTVQATLKDLDTTIGLVSSTANGLTLQNVTDNGNLTTNPIIFAGGTSTGDLMPGAHLTYDLGGPGRRWDEIWIRRTRIGTDSWTIETDTNNTFLISEDTNGNYFAITEDGKVGIGTSTPSFFDLEINGTVGPAQHNLFDLGSATSAWRNIIALGTVSSTNAIFTNADIGSLSVTDLSVGNQLDLSELVWANATGTNTVLGSLTVTSTLSLPNNSITDAMVSDTLTIGSLGNVSATSINSGVLGNSNVVLSLDAFGSVTGYLPATQISLASTNTAGTLDLQSYLNMLVANGRAFGGEVTQTASGTIQVSAGQGLIASDPNNPMATVYYTSWATSSGISVPLFEWLNIYLNYNTGSPTIVATTTDYNGDWTYYSLAKIYNYGDGALHIHDERSIETRPINRIVDFLEKGIGQVVTEGCMVSATGTRGIAVSQCVNWYASYERTISAFSTGDGDKFDIFYRDGLGGFINVHDNSQWDNLYYDDNSGSLQTLGPGEFGVHWVYVHEHGSVSLIYGRDSYTDLSQALSASAPTNVPVEFLDQQHAFLIGAIIFEQGNDYPDTIRDLRPVLVSRDGSSGGGSSSISNHNDLSGLQGGAAGQYYHLSATGFNSGNSLYFSSNNGGIFSLSANATTNTKITINNSYAGTASLDIIEGDLLLASTTRITNSGAAYFTNLNLSSNLYVSGTTLLTALTAGNVTSSNLFSTNADFTYLTAGVFGVTDLTWGNATGTYANIDNITGTIATFDNLIATSATFTNVVVMENTDIENLTFGNATGGNLVTYGQVSSTYIYVLQSELGHATAHNMVVDQTLRVGVGDFPIIGDSVAQFGGTADSYLQVNLQNHSSGTNASGDYIVTADIGDDSNYYVDLGINSSNYNNPDFSITGPLDAYLYAYSANLTIGTATASSAILFHAGGTESTDEVMRITADHYVGIGTTTPSHTLDVDGDGRFTGLLTLTSATTSELFWGGATGTNLSVTGIATLSANTTIGGQSVCLLDGTNCPSGTTPNLQTVTNTGNSTTHWIEFAGGTSTDALWLQAGLTVDGYGDLNNFEFLSASGTNLVITGYATTSYFHSDYATLGYATASNLWVDKTLRVGIGNIPIIGDAVAQFGGNIDSYLQVNIQNQSTGTSASSDFVATADIGDDSNYYIDLGINSSNYNDSDYSIMGVLDGYLYTNSANLTIGTATSGSMIKFHAGGTESTDEVMRITADHYVGIGTTTPSHALDVDGDARFTGLLTLPSATTSELFWGNATGTNLSVTGIATLSANTTIGGQSVCLLDGTNCPSSTSADLQTVTNTGNSTNNWIEFAGGTSTADFWFQQNIRVNGNVSSTSALFVNATATYIDFVSSTVNPSYFEGRLFYDKIDTALSYYNEASDVIVNIGEESIIKVFNNTGSKINDGQVVYISGADSDGHPTIALASAASSSTSRIMGMATHNIAINQHGYITRFGKVHYLDTSSFATGTSLYLSATTPGFYTATRPEAPNLTVEIGVVARSHSTDGIILVSLGMPRNGAITEGGIAFGTSNDYITDDENNFYWNNIDKRLGIGTGNPSSTLHVVGITQVQGIQFTHATGNSMYISGLIASDVLTVNTATSGNLVWTNATGTNLNVSGPTRLSADTRINGILPCLADGTNCPASAASNLQTVTNAGNTTTNAIQFAGGTSTADFRFQQGVWIDGNVSSTSALFINATGTNLAVLGYINSNLMPMTTDAYYLGDSAHRWQGLTVNYVTTTNILATGFVSSSAMYINGQAVTTSIPTLNQVTTQGNVTDNAIQFGGGTSTESLYLQSDLDVIGQMTFGNASGTNLTLSNLWSLFASTTNALFVNATGTNFALTGKVNSDLVPMINEMYDLGSIDYRWNNLFGANAEFTNVSTTNFIVTGNVNLGSASGTVVLQSDFNIESSAATTGIPWSNTNATSTNIESVRSLTVFNDYLYAGQGDGAGDGDIIMCDPTIGGNLDICDLAEEWSSSYDSASANRVNTLLSYKGRLYAGEGNGPGLGQVRYCRPELTGNAAICESGDWASASFTAGPYRVSQLISMHNVLYAANDDGVTGNAAVAVCNPDNAGVSTDCDNSADWTNIILPVLIYEEVPTLSVFNNRLYAFTGNSTGDNDIFICTPNVGGNAEYCDASADWSRTLNTSGADSIEASAVYNGFMFYGTGDDVSEGDLWSCDPSLAGDRLICDNATDLTLVYDSLTMNRMTAMMAYSGSLYFAGEGPTGDGDIYEYYVSYTSTSHPTAVFEATYAFAQYKGYLYAGRGNATGNGQIWYYRKGKGASGKIQMTAADTVGSFWFDEESFNSLGEGAVEEYSKGSFKFSHGIITDAGAYDLAEVYPTLDTSLQAGDVVALDEANYGMVRKSTVPYEQRVLGVVSSKPGFTLSGPQDGDSRAIALIGRVPVKISTENGDIKVGDPLTSASMPGYAMKAIKPGMIIGRAMEDFVSATYSSSTDNIAIATGTIRMVVQSGYYFGSEDSPLGQIAGFLGETTTTQIVQQAFDGDAYAIEQIAGGMVNPQIADGSALNDAAAAQIDVLIVRTAALIAGDLTVGGDSKLLGHIVVSGDTAGVVDLPVGENYVEIHFAEPFESLPVVVVTPESDASEYFAPWLGKFRIAKKTVNGFRIEVDEGVCVDPSNCGRTMRFNWLAVGAMQGESSTSTSIVAISTSTEPIVEEVVIESPQEDGGTVQIVEPNEDQSIIEEDVVPGEVTDEPTVEPVVQVDEPVETVQEESEASIESDTATGPEVAPDPVPEPVLEVPEATVE